MRLEHLLSGENAYEKLEERFVDDPLLLVLRTLFYGGLAQLARAPALQAGGQRFESVILHYSDVSTVIVLVITITHCSLLITH